MSRSALLSKPLPIVDLNSFIGIALTAAAAFTARVIASIGADVSACVTSAIGPLSSPVHGGAPSRAPGLPDEIPTPDHARDVVTAKVAAGEQILGFGYAVYRTEDPRSALLREVAMGLGGPQAELALAVEHYVVDVLAEYKPGRELYANVGFYAGIVMDGVRHPPRRVHPDVHREPSDRLGRTRTRTSHRSQDHPPERPLCRPTAAPTGPGTHLNRPPRRSAPPRRLDNRAGQVSARPALTGPFLAAPRPARAFTRRGTGPVQAGEVERHPSEPTERGARRVHARFRSARRPGADRTQGGEVGQSGRSPATDWPEVNRTPRRQRPTRPPDLGPLHGSGRPTRHAPCPPG